MAIVKNLASVMTTASITSSATSIPVNRTNVFGASQNPLDNPFYVTIMPASGTEPANLTNSEIALVTGISGTNLIVTRGQRSTTAKAFNSGAIVTNGIYAEDAVLLGEAGTAVNPQPWVRPADIVWSELLDKIYPVGSIYMSATLSTASAVATALGGTWVAWGAGRVPVGVDSSQTEFNTVGKTGGSKYMQDHTHDIRWNERTGRRVLMSYPSGSAQAFDLSWQAVNAASTDTSPVNLMAGKVHDTTDNFGLMLTGSSGNLQPYITCYMYKRTA